LAVVPRMSAPLQGLTVRLADLQERGEEIQVRPDADALVKIADRLGLVALPAFQATAKATPWFDGARLQAHWTATAVQTCGVSLEDFPTDLSGAFSIQILPAGSPNAPPEDHEVELDPDAPDPPDLTDNGEIDVGAYLIEHLGLALDPFPKKPGVVFEPPEPPTLISPFAALKDLKS
jgi:uncharacterized metal-binding protein YceD (DUF177 family)